MGDGKHRVLGGLGVLLLLLSLLPYSYFYFDDYFYYCYSHKVPPMIHRPRENVVNTDRQILDTHQFRIGLC